MVRELQLRVLPQDAAGEQALKQVVSRETGVAVGEINAVRILKRSIDARQRTIFVNLKVQAFIREDPTAPAYQSVAYGRRCFVGKARSDCRSRTRRFVCCLARHRIGTSSDCSRTRQECTGTEKGYCPYQSGTRGEPGVELQFRRRRRRRLFRR